MPSPRRAVARGADAGLRGDRAADRPGRATERRGSIETRTRAVSWRRPRLPPWHACHRPADSPGGGRTRLQSTPLFAMIRLPFRLPAGGHSRIPRTAARSLSGLTRNWREGKPSRWFWPTQHASVPGSSLGLRDFEGGSVAGVALLLPRAVLGPARALFRARCGHFFSSCSA